MRSHFYRKRNGLNRETEEHEAVGPEMLMSVIAYHALLYTSVVQTRDKTSKVWIVLPQPKQQISQAWHTFVPRLLCRKLPR